MPKPDILIVGGGLAGLFCALKLAPRPVTVLAAAPLGEGASSVWAQGGVAAAVLPKATARNCTPPTPKPPAAGIVDDDDRAVGRPRGARAGATICCASARRSTTMPPAT